MKNEPPKRHDTDHKPDDCPNGKRFLAGDWDMIFDGSFWANHWVSVFGLVLAFFFLSPILEYPNLSPFKVGCVAFGLWIGIGAGIYWVASGIIASMNSKAAGAAADIVAFQVPSLGEDLQRDKEPVINWAVKNFGKDQLHYRICANAQLCDSNAQKPDFHEDIKELKYRASLSDRDIQTLPDSVTAHRTVSSVGRLGDAYEDIQNGRKTLYATAAIVYVDSSGQTVTSTCCVEYEMTAKSFMNYDHTLNVAALRDDIQKPPEVSNPELAFDSCRMIEFTSGKPIDFVVVFHNQRTTECHVKRNSLGWSVIPVGTETQENITENIRQLTDEPRDMRVGPLAYFNNSNRPGEPLASEDASSVKAGTNVLIVWGRIEYDTADGKLWGKDYCLIFDGHAFRQQRNFAPQDVVIEKGH